MGQSRARQAGWLIVAVDLTMLLPAVALLVVNRPEMAPGPFASAFPPLLIGAIYPLLGAVVVSRQPRHPIPWILVALGITVSVTLLGEQYAIRGLVLTPGSLPGAGVAAWLQFWILSSFFAAGVPLLFLLFPTGRLPSARWIPVLVGVGLLFVAQNLIAMLPSGRLTAAYAGIDLRLDNPTGLYDANALSQGSLRVVGAGISLVFALVILACCAALISRLRRSIGVERQQTKWLAYVGSLLVVGLAVNLAAQVAGLPTIRQLAFDFAVLAAALGLPAATVIALLKYHLYGIDIVISRTVLVAGMAAFITLVYLALVVGIGSLVGLAGRPSLALSLTAAALIAIAFQPVRELMQGFANQIAYGHRASPYEVLAEFGSEVSASNDVDETLSQVARVLKEGVAAARAEVWVRVDAKVICKAAWPEANLNGPRELEASLVYSTGIPESTHFVLVKDRQQLLGALAVYMKAGTDLFPVEIELLEGLGVHMAVVLHNIGLSGALAARLDELRKQEAELRRSRQQVVEAQDAERRRLERNIHDGAQQHIVALAIKLRLAAKLVSSQPERAAQLLHELGADTRTALTIVRELSSGGQPLALQDLGLASALRIQAEQLPLSVSIDDKLTGRPDAQVEAAVYFTCMEAVQNAVKHASATRVSVWLASTADELRFSVTDDGTGFDSTLAAAGSGLRNMRERLASVGGEFSVAAALGDGTVVSGTVPLAALVPAS